MTSDPSWRPGDSEQQGEVAFSSIGFDSVNYLCSLNWTSSHKLGKKTLVNARSSMLHQHSRAESTPREAATEPTEDSWLEPTNLYFKFDRDVDLFFLKLHLIINNLMAETDVKLLFKTILW